MIEIYSDGRINPALSIERKTELSIDKFKKIHGDTYDYSLFQYINSKELASVICRKHGIFKVSSGNHLKGSGCPKCQYHGVKPDTKEVFMQKQQKVHGDLYDYSISEYLGSKKPISIICVNHGVFSITPANHINLSHGCPQCSNHKSEFLYLMQCSNTNLIKIGITNNIRQRKLGIGGDTKMLGIFKLGPYQVIKEKELHKRFQTINVYNKDVNNGNTEFFNLNQYQVEQLKEQLLKEVICK